MDDDHAGGPVARRARVLVVPAAVVQTALAGEQIRIPVRIVVHHHQDPAGDIHALEVVPLVFRGLDPVTDEHQLGVGERDVVTLHTARGDVVVTPAEVDSLAPDLEAPALRELRLDADDVERLLPAAAGEGGAVTHALQASLQIQPRQPICARARSPALQQVRGQEAHRRLERAARDVRACRLLDRGGKRRGLGHGHCRHGCGKHQAESPNNCKHVRSSHAARL